LAVRVCTVVPGTTLVIPVGEADFWNRPVLQRALDGVIVPDCGRVIVDLDGVTFMDASILGLLVDARHRVAAAGGRLLVTCRIRVGRRVLEAAGLMSLLDAPV